MKMKKNRHRTPENHTSKGQFPRFPDEVVIEAVVWLFLNQPKTSLFVYVAGGIQHVVRPKRDLPIADRVGEAHTFAHQPSPDAQSTIIGSDQISIRKSLGYLKGPLPPIHLEKTIWMNVRSFHATRGPELLTAKASEHILLLGGRDQ
jgi:hypothetical protein